MKSYQQLKAENPIYPTSTVLLTQQYKLNGVLTNPPRVDVEARSPVSSSPVSYTEISPITTGEFEQTLLVNAPGIWYVSWIAKSLDGLTTYQTDVYQFIVEINPLRA
jgi:hypothetical protein